MEKLTGFNADGSPVNYKDLPLREAVAHFAKQVYGYNLISNTNNEYEIDLISADGNCPNFECERSNVKPTKDNPTADHWKSKGFSEFLRNATPNVLYKTINYEERKDHFWIGGDHFFENGGYRYTETNHLTNMFVRTNYIFTQFIVICPKTILDPSKCYKAAKQPYNIHRGKIEHWRGYRRQDVDTYNLINGIFVLDTEYKESDEPIYKGYLAGRS